MPMLPDYTNNWGFLYMYVNTYIYIYIYGVAGGLVSSQTPHVCTVPKAFEKGVSIGTLYRTCGEINSERFNAIPLLPR